MRKLVTGVMIGLVLGAAATAIASTTRTAYLDRGDSAVTQGYATSCTVRLLTGRANGFVCNVGGDYRAKYGVRINESEVAITQYRGFNRYRVIVRKRQSPLP
jgi:hypothetical protein